MIIALSQKASMVISRVHMNTRHTVHLGGGGAGRSEIGIEKRGIYPRSAKTGNGALSAVVNFPEISNFASKI